ncbi:MAG: 3-deoxy-manno-octulosonate cytidylyltransferase [Alphaproteobacteria bacterium]|nr:3-deoxy-manno-octulosonate cytidylyltransferase [Alphaproteobacteria bacterium]
MRDFKPLIVIPTRLASARLPNKPLALIGGIPMIVHCVHRAKEAEIGDVVVAAADVEIVAVVEAAGGHAVLTDPDLPSGSDRVAAAVQQIDSARAYPYIINFQGDLPLFAPKDLRELIYGADPANNIVRTLAMRISNSAEVSDPDVVKVQAGFVSHTPGSVARTIGFSRAVVPWGQGAYWHHVGIYGYPRRVLEEFVQLPPSPLEQRERLEQLRLLENGYGIETVVIANTPTGVDTPRDLASVQKLWQARARGKLQEKS